MGTDQEEKEITKFLINNFIAAYPIYNKLFDDTNKNINKIKNNISISELKKILLTYLNYKYKHNFSDNDFYKLTDLVHFKVIQQLTILLCTLQSKYSYYNFSNLLETIYNLRDNSITHKCKATDEKIENDIIDFFKKFILVNENNLINLNDSITFNFIYKNYNFSDSFFKKLVFNGFYLNYCNLFKYNNIYSNNFNYKQIFNQYYLDDISIKKNVVDLRDQAKELVNLYDLLIIIYNYLTYYKIIFDKALQIRNKNRKNLPELLSDEFAYLDNICNINTCYKILEKISNSNITAYYIDGEKIKYQIKNILSKIVTLKIIKEFKIKNSYIKQK